MASELIIFGIWVVSSLFSIGIFIYEHANISNPPNKHILLATRIFSISPFLCLLLALGVIIGGEIFEGKFRIYFSNAWFYMWWPLSSLCCISVVFFMLSLLTPPYSREDTISYLSRFFALISAICSLITLFLGSGSL